ncbi:MAG: hypothetical protein AAF282_05475 [Cyanobacteria bacterium P01_A01_bin.15]
MADLTPANVEADAAANTVTSGSVRGAVTADAATQAFLAAVPNSTAESVFNLIQTVSAAALKVNAEAADADLLQTYPAPAVQYSQANNEFNYTATLRFKEAGQILDSVTSLSD